MGPGPWADMPRDWRKEWGGLSAAAALPPPPAPGEVLEDPGAFCTGSAPVCGLGKEFADLWLCPESQNLPRPTEFLLPSQAWARLET